MLAALLASIGRSARMPPWLIMGCFSTSASNMLYIQLDQSFVACGCCAKGGDLSLDLVLLPLQAPDHEHSRGTRNQGRGPWLLRDLYH